jgi:hypothetical protein
MVLSAGLMRNHLLTIAVAFDVSVRANHKISPYHILPAHISHLSNPYMYRAREATSKIVMCRLDRHEDKFRVRHVKRRTQIDKSCVSAKMTCVRRISRA